LICNRCTAEIFGSNDLSPSACCGKYPSCRAGYYRLTHTGDR
jgi:hypothetical protein